VAGGGLGTPEYRGAGLPDPLPTPLQQQLISHTSVFSIVLFRTLYGRTVTAMFWLLLVFEVLVSLGTNPNRL
jgi:hypothetical protein